jgi:hypothetical protein
VTYKREPLFTNESFEILIPGSENTDPLENNKVYIYKNKYQIDEPNADGEIHYGDGNIYFGSWKNYLPDGPGKLIYKNGNIYSGNFSAG